MTQPKSRPKEEIRPHLETTPLHIGRILAATDFSEEATLALKFAARLAKQLHSRLHVLHTVEPQVYATHAAGLTGELQKIEMKRGEEGLSVYVSKIPEVRTLRHEEIVFCGSPTEAIVEIVESKRIDLVVMGSHGRSGVRKMLIGSVAEATIRRLHCPVLVFGPRCSRRGGSLKAILLATDLHPGSLRATQYAMSIANETHATVTMLHVLRERAEEMSVSQLATAEEDASRELRQLTPHDAAPNLRVQFEVAAGKLAEKIVDVAKHRRTDLIVMGAKESSILADHASWATLSEILRASHCPVLAVQPHLA